MIYICTSEYVVGKILFSLWRVYSESNINQIIIIFCLDGNCVSLVKSNCKCAID